MTKDQFVSEINAALSSELSHVAGDQELEEQDLDSVEAAVEGVFEGAREAEEAEEEQTSPDQD